MGICTDPDKIVILVRKKKTSHSSGRNAGNRWRGKPFMATALIDWTVLQPEDQVTIPIPSTILEVSNKTDEMWDTHGYHQVWYNPLCQEKFVTGSLDLPPISDVDGEIVNFNTTSPSYRQVCRDTLPFISDGELDDLLIKTHAKLDRVISPTVSILNFIIELVELIEGNIRGVKRYASLYQRCMAGYRKAYLRFKKDGGRSHAQASWLAWNFAIKPFIKDLKAILCGLHDARKQLVWLVNNNHKWVTLKYKRGLTDMLKSHYDPNEYVGSGPLCSVFKADPPGTPVNGTYVQQVRWVSVELKYLAQSKIFLELPDSLLRGTRGIGMLWAAQQGITNPVGVFWEAIPFSWLIDYFLSARARLFQTGLDLNAFDKGVKVAGYGHSFEFEAYGDARVYNTTSDTVFHNYGGFSYSVKYRKAGLPISIVEVGTYFRLPIDWYKLSIIGSVFVGRRRHSH